MDAASRPAPGFLQCRSTQYGVGAVIAHLTCRIHPDPITVDLGDSVQPHTDANGNQKS
jgi:hypothetical protein